MAIQPPVLGEQDKKIRTERLKKKVDPKIFESIWSLYERCPYKIWTLSLTLRQDFIISQIEGPTVPLVHAAGHDDAVLLKIRGKLASVFIAKGHAASESKSVAEALTKISNGEVKQLSHQKDDQIYQGIIDRCDKTRN